MWARRNDYNYMTEKIIWAWKAEKYNGEEQVDYGDKSTSG